MDGCFFVISNHFRCKELVHHPIETTIKKTGCFGVPGSACFVSFFDLFGVPGATSSNGKESSVVPDAATQEAVNRPFSSGWLVGNQKKWQQKMEGKNPQVTKWLSIKVYRDSLLKK